MIDIENETLISLAEAAALVPCGRKGRSPDVKTVYAWTTGGCRGVVLESLQAGGRRATSKEAVRRFIAALTAGTISTQRQVGQRPNATQEAAVNAELTKLGLRL